MIRHAVSQFAKSAECTAVHLPFYFTPEVESARKGGINKLTELINVLARFARIRLTGEIDLLLFPVGGPQSVPMIRDILLLPWLLLFSRRVILHFHAAGIAEQLRRGNVLARIVSAVYRRAFAAVVMTHFNRQDPATIGITRVLIVPHRIPDEFDPAVLRRDTSATTRVLYVGHLCEEKGTPQLLQAFATLRRNYPDLRLELVGECLPPFTLSRLEQLIHSLELRDDVQVPGVLTGRAKAEAFGRAQLFLFPSVASYESFGLVLIEAMSWKLPIVATKWRGNAEVLTDHCGGIVFPVDDLSANIRLALDQALQRRVKWKEWGEANRAIFEQRYAERADDNWLVQALLPLATT